MLDYRGIIGEAVFEYVISRSRFIATARNVTGQEQAAEFIKEITARYPDATHNCYAYISNPEATEQKFSDAGEPQGTAGMPILEVLKKKKLACTAVVVTRYFGGVKLGAGGLAAAYTKSAAECIKNANVAEFKYSDYIKVLADYSLKTRLEQAIIASGGEVAEIMYGAEAEITAAVPCGNTEKMLDALMAVTAGKLKAEKLYKQYYIYK